MTATVAFGHAHVLLLHGEERPLVLKFARPGRHIASEAKFQLAAHQALSFTRATSRCVQVPRVIHSDHNLIVSEYVVEPPATEWPDLAALERSSRDLGRSLATIHALAATIDQEARLPWGRSLVDDWTTMYRSSNQPQRDLLDELAMQERLRRLVAVGVRSWNSTALIHADLRPANLVGIASGHILGAIDWESAGLGDPHWDLGCVLADFLQGLAGHPAAGGERVETAERLMRALMLGYVEMAPTEARDHRLVLAYAALFLLQQEWEFLENHLSGTVPSSRVALASSLAGMVQ